MHFIKFKKSLNRNLLWHLKLKIMKSYRFIQNLMLSSNLRFKIFFYNTKIDNLINLINFLYF